MGAGGPRWRCRVCLMSCRHAEWCHTAQRRLWALKERVPSCTAAHVEIPWSCGRCSVRSDAGPPRAPQMSGTTIDPAAAIAQALRGWKQRWPCHSRPVDARAHGIPSGRARANTMQRSGHAGHSVSRSTRSAAAPARRVQQECDRQRSDSPTLFLRYPPAKYWLVCASVFARAGECVCAYRHCDEKLRSYVPETSAHAQTA